MINAFPVIGWFLSFCASVSLAVPFWLCWTQFSIGTTYFNFLPAQWQSIPFWSCVGIFIVMSVVKCVFYPKLVTMSYPTGGVSKASK